MEVNVSTVLNCLQYCALLPLPWLILSSPPAQGLDFFLATQNTLPTMKASIFWSYLLGPAHPQGSTQTPASLQWTFCSLFQPWPPCKACLHHTLGLCSQKHLCKSCYGQGKIATVNRPSPFQHKGRPGHSSRRTYDMLGHSAIVSLGHILRGHGGIQRGFPKERTSIACYQQLTFNVQPLTLY